MRQCAINNFILIINRGAVNRNGGKGLVEKWARLYAGEGGGGGGG